MELREGDERSASDVVGFFMKMVIADRAAVLVNQVFGIYYMFSGVALTLAIVLFAIQIYCDFASYSVIAMGAAKVLGIDLMTNFEAPFFSRTSVSSGGAGTCR